jgi:fatty-acyl-CoA synthase
MQLNIKSFIERGGQYFPDNPIVSRRSDNSLFRYTYGEMEKRVRRLSSRLASLGAEPGDKLATLAWNTYRHYELYFAIPCTGSVLHTVNLRLTDEHIAYIINKAQDKLVFVDPDLLPVIERLAPDLPSVKGYIVLAEEVPATTLSPVYCYEDLIRDGDEAFEFPEIDEHAPAGMCFTSATTGNPKGVIYSHRQIYLHTTALCMADSMAVRERDTFLPMVPMFHANAWGIPFAAAWMGSAVVLPGERPHVDVLLNLIEQEKVTFFAAAVSTGVEMMGLLKQGEHDLSCLRSIMLGGSATPRSVMEFYMDNYGVPIYTAWGSTEMAPIATFTHIHRDMLDASEDEKISIRIRQGLAAPGTELYLVDDDGNRVPWDDETMGEVYVRTPWSSTEYYEDERTKEGFVDGWWRSGDIATINERGVLRLVDRAKDLIKSGGEWISSQDLENGLMSHPAVLEVAVVAVPDDRWVERPAAIVVFEATSTPVSGEELKAFLAPNFAKWWLPEHYLVMEALPKTGVGKINKKLLREQAEQMIERLA